MLHNKAQVHWLFGSGEEIFLSVFTIYGRCGHFGHVTQRRLINFHSSDPWRLHMKFGFYWPSDFGEDLENGERMDDNGQRTTTDGRRSMLIL